MRSDNFKEFELTRSMIEHSEATTFHQCFNVKSFNHARMLNKICNLFISDVQLIIIKYHYQIQQKLSYQGMKYNPFVKGSRKQFIKLASVLGVKFLDVSIIACE